MKTRDQIEALISTDGVLGAGRTLFEGVPAIDRPVWAGRVLRAAMTGVARVPASVSHVEALSAGPTSAWVRGHEAFDAVRVDTMRLGSKKYRGPGLTSAEERTHHLLLLAELVAKVIYNGTKPDDDFDEDSGWNILPVVRRMIVDVGESTFEGRLWTAMLSC